MARSTGIILAVGGITLANEAVFAPIASHGSIKTTFNWRIVPATAVAAVLLTGVESIAPRLAVGIAYISLITVTFARLGAAPAPIENLAKVLSPKKT
jgi:hypothetical protein